MFPDGERVRLKVAGLMAMGLAALPLGYVSTQIPGNLWSTLQARYSAGAWSLGVFLTIGIVAVNVFIVGALAVITGVRKLSLDSRRTRKGVAVMWTGANALVLGLVAGLYPTRNDVWVEWTDVSAVLAYALVATGILLVRSGWKHDVRRASDVLATDPRPPVVYLRSFQDDVKSPIGGVFGTWMKLVMWFLPVSFEQELAAIMNRLGPFVAVGRPGERLPELGANRFYFTDGEWQGRVSELVQQARLTVILCGATANLWWEIDHVLATVPPRRIVLLIPYRGKRTRDIEEQIERRLGSPGALLYEEPRQPLTVATLLFGRARTLGKVVHFADDRSPVVEPITYVRSVRAGLAMMSRPFSLFSAPLEAAFEPVFRRLDLPWTYAGPNRSMAIVLALCSGFLGLHHFYLGDRRRGLKYLAFFWSGVPYLLALRDASRLVLMDQAEFEATYGPTRADRVTERLSPDTTTGS